MSKKKTYYIIDISSLFFRSYYAISAAMKSPEGLHTNALYGVFKMLQMLEQKHEPDFMISCFDTKKPSFRKKLDKEYKANRGEMPEDLEEQVPYLKKMMDILNIPYWEKEGFEADDLIASLISHLKKKAEKIYIISGDKDFAQIVGGNVYLYDTMKEIIYDAKAVEDKWGLPPSQMLDYLSIVGDSSDNIKGIKGVGSKGALKLLKEYKSLEGIYKNLDELKGSLQENVRRDKKQAFLARKLVSLRSDLKPKASFFKNPHKEILKFDEKERKKLKAYLEELGFKSFLKKFGFLGEEEKTSPKKKESTPISKPKKSVSKTASKLKQLSLKELEDKLEPYPELLVGRFEEEFYLSFKKFFFVFKEKEKEKVARLLDYKWARYQGHDIKNFWKWLDIKKPVAIWDSLVAGHLLSSKGEPSLRWLFKEYLDIPEEKEISLPDQILYEMKLKDKLEELLEKIGSLDVLKDLELPLIPVLYDMEKRGFLMDWKEIKKQSQGLGKDLEELEFKIHKLAGEKFNVSSSKQLSQILFEKLGLPKGRKIKTGYSTDSAELMKMRNLHPILPLLMEYRELFKLKSAYTDSFLTLKSKDSDLIHTEFKQTIASTGRLSSINPNLQNIPIRTERGQNLRKAFTSKKDHHLICADYSQLELRILAEITGDENLKKAFENDQDIHAKTASEIFHVPLREVSEDLRRKAKAVNFGIAYGQGAFGLAETLFIPRSEAKEIIDNYFKKFKKIKDYIETVKEELPKKAYVKTLYGRKRHFDKDSLKHPRQKAALERAAINAPLQGTASEIVKKAMIELDKSLPIPILSQVHDELLFECPVKDLEEEKSQIQKIMEKNEDLKVPLKVNIASGKTWFVAHN